MKSERPVTLGEALMLAHKPRRRPTPRPPVACPRCGHDSEGDPSRQSTGDHLVIVEHPMSIETVEQGTVHTTIRATQNVQFVWCSNLIRPPKET